MESSSFIAKFKKAIDKIFVRFNLKTKEQIAPVGEVAREKHYITLGNGRKVRVKYNRNVEAEFYKHTGNTMALFIKGKAGVLDSRCLVWLMVIEGENADGRRFLFSEKEFGRLFIPSAAVEINKILMKMAIQAN